MRCKVYATDEGFGPLVRQSAVIEELQRLDPGLEIVFQTHTHLDAARGLLSNVEFIDRFNNITWHKQADGSPDVAAIRAAYVDYEARSDALIELESREFAYDFVISDFVCEAFEVARRHDVPAFGIAHFTWDWFFSKLFPVPLSTAVLDRLHDFSARANSLYFPPFTPREILGRYHALAKQVPLVVRTHEAPLTPRMRSGRMKVLVIDSGSRLLREHMLRALRNCGELPDFHFFLPAGLEIDAPNVSAIPAGDLYIDHIPHMDLVIARAGFNTISECIAFRKPMLLVGEAMNPEMNENMINIKNEGLGSFVALERFTRSFNTLLPNFIEHEFRALQHAMDHHEIPTDGARIIAEDILDRIYSGAARGLTA